MLAVNYSTIRNKLKDYCDKATDDNETVIVTRKDEKNVVLMSLEHYNELMKIIKNAEYLIKIDKSIEQIEKGKTGYITATSTKDIATAYDIKIERKQ